MSIEPIDEVATVEPQGDARIKPLTGSAARYALGLLLAISIVNYLDRQVINILNESIKKSLHLADWQLGMLTGLAFGLLYTFLGLPIARAAERGDRPRIIAAAAGLWSVFTLVCGLVQNFTQLALARVGVGVGEAGCTPPAHSLIMDYVAPEKRSSALAFYGLGPPIGGLLGLAIGGLVADAYGWRAAFLVAGVPGLIFAVLAATTLIEPRKTLTVQTRAEKLFSLKEMFAFVRNKRSYWWLGAAITLNVFISLGFGGYLGSFFFRNHTVELAALAKSFGLKSGGFLGLSLGILSGIGGGVGTWLGGNIADRLGPSDPRRYLYVPAVASLLGAPLFMAMLLAPSIVVSLAFYGLFFLVSTTWYGPAFTAWFSLVPPRMRATNSAFSLFVSNLVGLGLAPIGVGKLSDMLGAHMGSGEGLRWALVTLACLGPVTAFLFWRGAKSFRGDIVV
jgi:MFS family permease